MGKALAGFGIGLACLFLFSMTFGVKVFTAADRALVLTAPKQPDLLGLSERESWGKKVRLSMNSFDLANGLTFRHLEDIRQVSGYRLSAFLSLLVSLWLVLALRRS